MVRRNVIVENVMSQISETDKGCPFCGSRDVKVDTPDVITYFLCDNCGAVVSFRANEDKEKAEICWNRRS